MSRVSTPPVAKPVTQHGPATTTPPATSGGSVPHEKIAMRAYEKWLTSGCQHGCDRQHWMEAEQELKTEMTRQSKR